MKTAQKDKIVDLLAQLKGWMDMDSCEEIVEEKKRMAEHMEQLNKAIDASSLKGLECMIIHQSISGLINY